MKTNYHLYPGCSGFTLLEVLIAALVMSVGLLGLAGLQIMSLKNTHSASMVSQASLLASSIADEIRAIHPAKYDDLVWPRDLSDILTEGIGTVVKNSSNCPVDNDNNGYLIQIQWADKNKYNKNGLNKMYEFCFYHEDEE